jgi:hypothetical protein
MEVSTSLRRSDVFIANVLNLYRRWFMWVIGALPAAVLFIGEIQGRLDDPQLGLVLGVLAMVALVVMLSVVAFGVGVGATVVAFRPGKMAGVLGRHLYRIGPDGLSEESDVSTSTLSWRGVEQIRSSRFGLLIQLPNTSAHYIPRRSFDTAEKMELFAAEAQRCLLAARTSSS